MFKLVLEKAEEPEIKLPTSAGSLKKQEFQKNIYFCFIDYTKAFDCVDHNKLWKILTSLLALKTLTSSQKELPVTPLCQVFSSHLHKPLGLLFSSSRLCFCWDWFPRSLLWKYKSSCHSRDLLCLTGSRLALDHS